MNYNTFHHGLESTASGSSPARININEITDDREYANLRILQINDEIRKLERRREEITQEIMLLIQEKAILKPYLSQLK